MSINNIVLTGRLTADPEIKHTQGGKAYAKFSLAVSRFKKGETDFINCTAWDKTAEVAGEYLRKGSMVGVQGALRINVYEKDGKKTNYPEVQVSQIEFLDTKKSSGSEPSSDPDDYEAESNNAPGGTDDDFPF